MHRGCLVWTPTPPLAGRRTPRPGPVRVRVCVLSLPGRAARPLRRLLVRPTFSSGRSVFPLFSAPFGLGLPLSWSFVGPPLVSPPPPFFFFPFFSLWRAPFVSCFLWLPAPAPLGLGGLFFFPPPPPPACGFFVFFCAHPLSLAFSGFRPGVPWALALCAVCFACLLLHSLRALSPCLCFPPGSWLLPGGCPPPPPYVSRRFRRYLSLLGFFFPLCAPIVCGFCWFPAPGALGLGAVGCLFCWHPASLLSVRSRLVCVSCLAVGCSLVVAPNPHPFLSRCFRCSVLRFLFLFSLTRSAPPLSLPPLFLAFSGFRPRVPWVAARFLARCALSPLLCPPPGRWLLPGGCCPPPLLYVSQFMSLPLGPGFFFFVLPRCLWLSHVSGPGCPGLWRCVLFVLLATRFSAGCAPSPLLVFFASPWAASWCLLPPPTPFCVSRFSSLPLGAPFFFSLCVPIVSGIFWFPALGALDLGTVCCLFPAWLVVVPCVLLHPASCRVVLRSVLCFVLCLVLCGVLVSGWVLAPCCGGSCCAVFVVLCCCALLRFLLVFFLWSLAFPWCFGLFRFLCFACAVRCRCACVVALCALLSCPGGAGWCFVLLSVVFACLLFGLAVLCCLLLGPDGSWCRDSVVCCGVSLGALLRRVAACRAALRCVVVRCVVSFCSAWCCRALCPAFGRCPSSSCPVFWVLCFVLSRRAVCVELWCVAAWCSALYRVRPGVSCCAFPVLSALCGVAVLPCSPLVPCSTVLCPVVLCCRVVLWCPVLLPCLFGFSYL